MNFFIVHELPQRLRVRLEFPRSQSFNFSPLEHSLGKVPGVRECRINSRLKTALVKYNGTLRTKTELLQQLRSYCPPLFQVPASSAENSSAPGKKEILIQGGLLLASPLIPKSLWIALTLKSTLPRIFQGIRALFQKKVNADVLDATSIGVALGLRDFRTAGIIAYLLRVGEYLEGWAKQKSKESLSTLLEDQVKWIWVIQEGQEVQIPRQQLIQGAQVVVRAGSSIPIDGIVLTGEALVNQASMTGEPLAVMKRKGNHVYAGTVLEEGKLVIEANQVGEDTRIAKIIQTIEESENLKAQVQSRAETLADQLVPYSFLLSGLTYAFTGNPLRAASVLLVDFSCAIKLATPLTVLSTMVRASREGVLIKGGKYLEILAEADVFVFDKTGTLTKGTPRVVDIIPLNGYERNYLLKNVACVEEHFPHPLASAIVRKAAEEGLTHEENHTEVKHIMAHGLESSIEGKQILIGSRHFLEEDSHISMEVGKEEIRALEQAGQSLLYVAIGGQLVGLVAIEDPIRPEAKTFLVKLHEKGIKKTMMLTGDQETTAHQVAQQLVISDYRAQLLPEDKIEIIRSLQREGHIVAMVGDGMNDSPALSYADVGISLQQSSDIAKETSNVLLMNNDLNEMIKAIQLSRRGMSRINQNYRYIMGINSSLILLGLLGITPPIFSAFVHNATTVMVAANAMR
ncbi:MAG: heavy metal translocating P-type ATPase [SAR324 cluster bacterium]|uniref:Heavy metal translocating P-type ATPase n=1 Tax=SAR324 cluster bacterium TaxID=2024889 RepID=A0A2A4T201_9DELT|nr:MAG: heavy metal translocating P-type ATPase [SAR324 cluster bacterium]